MTTDTTQQFPALQGKWVLAPIGLQFGLGALYVL